MKIPPPRIDPYKIIAEAVFSATRGGIRKAEKWGHLLVQGDDLNEEAAADIIASYIMAGLEEVVDWDSNSCHCLACLNAKERDND